MAWQSGWPVEPLVLVLDDTEVEVREAAAWALACREVLPLPSPPDLDTLPLSGQFAVMRERSAARPPDPAALVPLRRLASDASPRVRRWAFRGLGRYALDDVSDVLARGLHDDDRQTRLCAVRGLADRDDRRVLPLLRAALDDPYCWVRDRARVGMCRVDRDEADEAAMRLLHDRNRLLRLHAASQLAQVGNTKAVPALIGLLQRATAPWLRASVARALGEIGDERAVPVLTELLGAAPSVEPALGDDPVARCAREALQRIGTLDARRALRNARR
jgi:HEAT repeat protein